MFAAGTLIFLYPAIVPEPECDDDALSCVLANDVMRDVAALAYDLKRARFDRRELPLLSIYLSDGALDKLDQKRRETLAKPGQIMMTEESDWVDASVVSQDGTGSIEASVRLRLKGDWLDHFDHPTKLSFRIVVRDSNYILGMKRFSIQHPKTRKFQLEKLFIDESHHWGILAPRYQFVEVRINDYRIGIMALEEHYSKELLESQRRRDGPIVTLDEDIMWRQRDLNYRVNQAVIEGLNPEGSHVVDRDFAVRQFQAPPEFSATPAAIQAQALYRNYIDGKTPPEQAFDLAQMARWWVLTNSWNACHAAEPHNRRFYYNPVTARLEPIAFDNYLAPTMYRQRSEPCDRFVAHHLMQNDRFREAVLEFSRLLVGRYSDPLWTESFRRSQMAHLKILGLDSMSGEPVYVADLLENLASFLEKIQFNPGRREVNDQPNLFALNHPEAELISHMRAFWSVDASGATLELKNLTGHPIRDIEIKHAGAAVSSHDFLPSFRAHQGPHTALIELPGSYQPGNVITLEYQYQGEGYIVNAEHQFRHAAHRFNDARISFPELDAGVTIDAESQTVTVHGGHLPIAESVEMPPGWSLRLEPGSRIELMSGALLKIQGALQAVGEPDRPIEFSMSSEQSDSGTGVWGGVLVTQAAETSLLRHTVWVGAGASGVLAQRQDARGLTGCLTFYESEVLIEDSRFVDAHCEDALNAVRTQVHMKRITILRPAADGFDCDFCFGIVEDSRFEDTGNDGVDVSGSNMSLAELYFEDIGDKAVSIGEKSEVLIEGINVAGATTGVASKDLSRVAVRNSRFSGISGSALIAYVKKGEYGGASIVSTGSIFQDVYALSARQLGSLIVIDNSEQPVSNFDQVQLREAGYVTGP